jgi:hypothetical protein
MPLGGLSEFRNPMISSEIEPANLSTWIIVPQLSRLPRAPNWKNEKRKILKRPRET